MTSAPEPRISVIMPVFNAAAYVAEALESIRAQTCQVWEIVAVDDGSTDESAQIVARFPEVRLVRREHRGLAEALNCGLEHATGDYLAFLDADDRWLPGKTALQMAAFRADPRLDVALGLARRFHTVEQDGKRVEVTIDVMRGASKICLLVKRSSFEKAGRFPTGPQHDFLDWYCRAHEAGLSMRMLPEVVAERRIHDSNHGIVHRAVQRQRYFGALKASLDRRRQKNDALNPAADG